MAKRKKATKAEVKKTVTFLKKFTQAFGPSSFEDDVRKVFEDEVKNYADDICTCGLGSIIASKTGSAKSPRIMIAGHMDEIGFMVRGITKNGYIKFNPIGGWWGHVVLGQKVLIRTRKGKEIVGVIGSKAPHILSPEERKKVMQVDKMYIDVGSYNDYNAPEKLGIKPGDPIIPISEFYELADGRMLMAKAWDNRVGVAVAVDVIRKLKGIKHPNTVFGVGTVQEEVGLRGAGTSAFQVEPDVAFAIDVTIAADTPGSDDAEFAEQCGEGPSISVMDGSLLPNPILRDLVVETAEEKNIPYQFGSLTRGGTDGGRIAMSKTGVPTLTLSVPSRYIHSHNSIIHIEDYINLVKLLTEVIKKLDTKAVKKIRNR
ncbi:peptidase M28 [bacterium]|nr:MAG: peptidase M28 [bacterium]